MLSDKLRAATAGAQVVAGQAVFIASWSTGFAEYIEYSWVVPENVTEISAVVISPGRTGVRSDSSAQGGRGGNLRYINGLSVTPGETLTVRVGRGVYNASNGADGANTSILRGATVLLTAGWISESSTIGGNIGGADGGLGGTPTTTYAGGGGGAAGYSGTGGYGQNGDASYTSLPSAGSGAAYGGGRSSGIAPGGGGVGLVKRGTTGSSNSGETQPGSGGFWADTATYGAGLYGAGGGGNDTTSGAAGGGAPGGCRIIWGEGRTYPDASDDYVEFTNTAYSEIEVRIMTPYYSGNPIGSFRISGMAVEDETGTDFFLSLTPVTGLPTSSFSSISAGQFTLNSVNSIPNTDLNLLKDGDPGSYVPSVQQNDVYTPLKFFIKPSSPKKVALIEVTAEASPIGMVHWVEVYGDGNLITRGQLVPSRTNAGYFLYTINLNP